MNTTLTSILLLENVATICQVQNQNRWINIPINLNQDNLFQAAMILTSRNESQMNVSTIWQLCGMMSLFQHSTSIKRCDSTCESVDILQPKLGIEVSAQTLFDMIVQPICLHRQLQDGLRNILHEFNETETVFLTSPLQDLHWLPSSFKTFIFHIESGFNLNKTLTSIYSPRQTTSMSAVILCSVKCIMDILSQADLIEPEKMKPMRWLVVPTDFTTIAGPLNSSSVTTNAVIIAVNRIPCTNETLEKGHLLIYRLESKQKIKLQQVGSIDRQGNIRSSENLFPQSRSRLNGKHLIVATLAWPPWVTKYTRNGTILYDGVCMEMLNELSSVLNFSFTIVEPEDGMFGTEVNGNWTGLIGQLVYKKVDLVAAPLVIQHSRQKVIDFTVPFDNQVSVMILNVPDPGSSKWLTLIAPFRFEVHICILFALVLSTVFLFLVEEVNPGNLWTDNKLSARGKRYGDILWYHFGALVVHGGSNLPSTVSGRTLLSCWWLFTVISAAAYSGNLIAFLSDLREKLPFNSLAEMVEQDTYSWGTIGGSAFVDVFKNSRREDYQHIWKGLENNPLSLSTDFDEHMRRIKSEQYVLLGESIMTTSWGHQDCDLRAIKDPFLIMYSAFGLQKNSIYTEILTERILRLSEMGLPDLWYRKWNPHVQCGTDKSAKRVDILGLQSIFYAAGIGIVLASIVLSFELFYCKTFRNK